jgi:hypothetical protein
MPFVVNKTIALQNLAFSEVKTKKTKAIALVSYDVKGFCFTLNSK